MSSEGRRRAPRRCRLLQREIDSVCEHIDVWKILNRITEGFIDFLRDYDALYLLDFISYILFNPRDVAQNLAHGTASRRFAEIGSSQAAHTP